jgi:hypothetical protein
MATATPTPEPTNVPALATEDAFTAALRNAGFLSPASAGTDFHRLKVQGQNIVYGEDIIASYNAKTKEPALYVQLSDAPTEYQAMWFDKDGELARAVGRPGIAGKMCKSHFDNPNEARKFAQDGTSCDSCPIHPFMPKDQLPPEARTPSGDAKKCSWKADVDLYILDKQEDGTLARLDDTLYTMSLPTTAVIEFKGSSSKKSKGLEGSVSPENFMVKLARLGITKWGEEGLLKAMTYLRLGGVIAELRILPAKANDGAFSYNVVSFTPIDILEVEEPTALPGPAAEDGDASDVPF